MHPFKAVIFDYGKVLSLPPAEEEWKKLSARFGTSLQEFQAIYWRYREAIDLATLSNADYWKAVGRDCGVSVSDAEAGQLIDDDNARWTHESKLMLALARDLRAAGYRTAILSNMEPNMLAFMRKKFAWLNNFDAQVYSCETGVAKPDEAAYRICCERLGCNPSEALFLDDKRVNVEAARRFGMQSYVFHSAPDPVMLTGDAEITVEELRKLLLDGHR
jgi:putative hydrolase of the HAD superfamily